MAFPNNPSDGQEYDKWYYDAASEEWKLIASLKDPLWRDNEDGSIYYSNGNVGIGVDSPSQKLHVYSDTNTYVDIERPSKASGQVGIQLIGGKTDGRTWTIYQPQNENDLRFYNGGDLLTIDATGNVGVGNQNTVTPNSQGNSLVIDTGKSDDGMTVVGSNSSNIFFADAADHRAGRILYLHSDDSMRFYTNGNNTRLTIDASGDATVSGTVKSDNGLFTRTNFGGIQFNQGDANGPLYLLPRSSTGFSNGVTNLGSSANRFKDAHLSGTVNSTALALGNWKIELDGNNLAFKYNGTKVFKLETTGKVISKNDVRAFGTP
jgi:hypothetical protein